MDRPSPRGHGGDGWAVALDEVLARRSVTTAFQPIVDLQRLTVVGYEALGRFPEVADVGGAGPDVWFAEAERRGRGAELASVTLRTQLDHARRLPPNCFLSVNVDPNHLRARPVQDALAEGRDLRGVVLELTEHTPWDWEWFEPIARHLRRRGALLALDDAGAGHSGLRQMLQLRPEIVKLDREIVSGVHDDEAKATLVEMVGVFADRIDAWVLAEGVETEDEARCLQRLGVPLAQGWFFGRPSPTWDDVPEVVSALLVERPGGVVAGGLHELVHAVAPADPTVAVPALPEERSQPWRPVLDGDRRPLGLLRHGTPGGAALTAALVVNVRTSVSDVVGRLAAGTQAVELPIVVTDDRGRYLGLIPLRRLLGEVRRLGLPGDGEPVGPLPTASPG